MNIKLFFIMSLLTPSLSFAFFCPNNFNQINFGYSPEQVANQCGQPDKIATREIKPVGPQEWSYLIPQTVSTGTSYQTQGTLKTQVTFDENDKAVNISVNGIGVGSTTICGGRNVQLGDSRDAVRNACGKPSFINKQEPSDDINAAVLPPPTKVIEYMYNLNSTNPSVKPVKLIFENGQLKSTQ